VLGDDCADGLEDLDVVDLLRDRLKLDEDLVEPRGVRAGGAALVAFAAQGAS
jgi:hypothetical protein